MNITNKLNRKIQIFQENKIENEIGEYSLEYSLYKTIYAQVIPLRNSITALNEEVEQVTSQYKFIIRKKSLLDINERMEIYLEHTKYKIDYWNLDFKNNEYLEIFGSRVE